MRTRILSAMALMLAAASVASAEVTVERVTYMKQPGCVRLSNGTVEVIVTTAIGRAIAVMRASLKGRKVFALLPVA